MAFAGSMFAGITKGAADAFSEQGLGGQLYKSIVAAQGRNLLKERDAAGNSTNSPLGGGIDSAPASSGAGTPYGTGSGGGGGGGGGDRPTPGAPYVQEKPVPPPPGMDTFARKGKPIPPASPDFQPPEQQTYEPYPGGKNDPNLTPLPIPALPTAVQGYLPGATEKNIPAFLRGTPPAAQGAVPAFVPQSIADTISSWGAGPPKPGDVRGGNVYNGVSWVPAPTGAVVPGTTAPVTPGQALPITPPP
jgi:hypothetical protein